ncbi:MAG: hypothetical protein RLN72_16205 [Henriciella sp.]
MGIDYPDEDREEVAASVEQMNTRASTIYGDCFEDMVFAVLEPAGTDADEVAE